MCRTTLVRVVLLGMSGIRALLDAHRMGRWKKPRASSAWIRKSRSYGHRCVRSASLVEGLVDAEIDDLQTKWVHTNERIGHSVAQGELHLRHVRFMFSFLPRSLAVVALFE